MVTRVDVPALARRLRDCIMALHVVRTVDPLPEGMSVWQAPEKRTGSADKKRAAMLGFRCTGSELRTIRACADACRLPVSVYARRRVRFADMESLLWWALFPASPETWPRPQPERGFV